MMNGFDVMQSSRWTVTYCLIFLLRFICVLEIGLLPFIKELQREVSRLSHQLEVVEARLRNYEPDPDTITSIKQAEWCERFLTAALNRINEIKEELLRNHVFSQGQGFGQTSLDGEDETFPFKVDDVALLPEIPLHPINISMEYNALFRSSDVVIDKTIDEGNIVGPQAPVCQVNRQVDLDWPPWLQDYTSSELLAMFTTPTLPEMEAVKREGVVAGMPSQEEEAGPGADDDDDVGGSA
ncbi:agamous-like MADS-box protein AGL104 isoform X2 [Magnolia sinica]|uniref:agamous-like MADS-box protein AGL104 isoform X2 n=1 Tax=Magnolia sinica TaxID=86752 RepID=UPI0026585F69|nr:agamous-like MADS-box protein AGL104 isoform X2 [Magnolia sinica]